MIESTNFIFYNLHLLTQGLGSATASKNIGSLLKNVALSLDEKKTNPLKGVFGKKSKHSLRKN